MLVFVADVYKLYFYISDIHFAVFIKKEDKK